MSLTGAAPTASVSQAAAAAGTATGPAQAVVVQVLASYGGDSVRNGLVQTLQNATGAGNVISGTITDVRADGTFTLQTKAGPELVLHHPPELPLTVGSAVTLRIVSVSPTPQVAILTVDGRLVGSQLAGTAPTAAPGPSVPLPSSPGAVPLPGAALPATSILPTGSPIASPATLAATLLAVISLEDEVAIESALSGDGALAPLATPAPGDAIQADAQSVIATLVRPAPARPGSAPIPVGTRYLATLSIGGTESEAPDAPAPRGPAGTGPAIPADPTDPPADATAPEPAATTPANGMTATPAGPAPTDLPTPQAPTGPAQPVPVGTAALPPDIPAPSPGAMATQTASPAGPPAAQPAPSEDPAPPAPLAAPPIDLTRFTALTIVLAGRVLPTSTDSQTLVETAVGTLAIPVQDAPPPTGAAIQLKVAAVAPPDPSEKPAVVKAPPQDAPTDRPPLQEAAAALAPVAPPLAQQIQTQLSLPPNDQLAALILNFLGGLKAGAPPTRWPDPPARKALVEAGRSDIASRLDAEASQIGQTRPAPPGDWSVTILPYLGLATTKPMRLYRRIPDDEERQKGGGDRFVIELHLVRLGAMQFDGLVRERRFDLVLRSEQPLDDGLRVVVERTFRDALLISGWSGELSYARTGPVPLVPLKPDGGGVGLSA